jgi:hypothetical protein
MRGATNRAGCRTKTLIQTYLAFECYGFESIAIVENLSCVHPVQSNPVVPSPTKHAANWAHCKHGQQAVKRAQLRLFEFH